MSDLWGLGLITGQAQAEDAHDGDGMIALVPRIEDAQRFAVPGEEPPEALHVTLQYFGEEQLATLAPNRLVNVCRQLAVTIPPIQANVFGHATLNPGPGMCAVYVVGTPNETSIEDLHNTISRAIPSDEQHSPFLSHMTAGYGIDASVLQLTGPLVLDRIWLSVGGNDAFFPLGGT